VTAIYIRKQVGGQVATTTRGPPR